jgi:hypothetical protein
MTEAQWLACEDVGLMLYYLSQGDASDRKLRLFAIGCCLRTGPVLKGWVRKAVRDIVEAAVRYADGLATREELQSIITSGPGPDWEACQPFLSAASFENMGLTAFGVSQRTAAMLADAYAYPSRDEADPAWLAAFMAERAVQLEMFRDIFGNPFRPAKIDPAWRSSRVIALARGIYDNWAFDGMPSLGDALEDEGCDDAEILSHCRSDAEHVRGCWVVDALLGKL